jgi:4-hydroxybenzoate polyprenyltransferase
VAVIFASTLIAAGLLIGTLLFPPLVVACYAAVICINLVYSLWGRDVPYVDLILNALPHVVRFLMGALLVGRVPHGSHLLALALLAVALSCVRRQVERSVPGWEARRTLTLYGPHELGAITVFCLAGAVALAVANAEDSPGFYGVLLITTVVLVGGAHASSVVRGSLKAVWLR